MKKVKRPPVTLPDGTVQILLTQGQVAIVGAEDADLAQLNWIAHRSVHARTWYARRRFGYTPRLLHRVIGERMGLPAALEFDHIDGNGLNNRRSNLRPATHSQNMQNKGMSVRNKVGLKGVHWCNRERKWVAQIRLDRRTKFLGYFATAEAAHSVYVAASEEMHGSFGRAA